MEASDIKMTRLTTTKQNPIHNEADDIDAKLCRQMGPLETMYHVYHRRGIDIYAQIINILMKNPFSKQHVKNALDCLVKRHPLLRMKIAETKFGASKYFRFIEIENFVTDLREIQADDLEAVLSQELEKSLNLNEGPLWRFTIIHPRNYGKACSKFKHSLSFMFKCHHSIADAVYLHQLYSDFIYYLDSMQRGCDIKNQIEELLFFPSIEKLMPILLASKTRDRGIEPKLVSFKPNNTTVDALTVYNNCFKAEIESLSKSASSTKVMRLNMTEGSTKDFLMSCKLSNVSVTGACIASACVAMTQLLRNSLSSKAEVLHIPVEIMINLRRYIVDPSLHYTYPGVAAIHVPLDVTVSLARNLEQEETFIDLSRQITRNIERLISCGKPLEVMSEESRSCDQQTTVGKSPFVICFTNLSNVDQVLRSSLKDRIKIGQFPGITKVAVDDMPIFFIGAFTLNKRFELGVEYCSSYTSEITAANFSWKLKSRLEKLNKL